MENEKNLMQTLVDDAYVQMFKNYETRVEMIDDCKESNLNHFWNRNKFLDFWGLNKMPYNQHYHEEKHDNVKFLLADNLQFEQDSNRYACHGTYAGQTKVKDLGNDIVTDFFMFKPSQDLDLTWMKSKDVFHLHDSIQYRNLKNIMVNVDNLAQSSLNAYSTQYDAEEDLALNLIVTNRKTKLGAKDQIASFRSFFEYQDADNSYRVKHVTLDGFSDTMSNVIYSYLEEKGITASRRKNLMIDTDSKVIKFGKAAENTADNDLTK